MTKQSANLESGPQRISGHAERVCCGLIGQAGGPESFSPINVDLGGEVLPPVNVSGKNDKVLNSVIGFDAVDVMHFLTGDERPANVPLHDEPMFFDPFAVVPNDDVPMCVYGPAARLPDMLARPATKMSRCVGGFPVGPVERGSASRADALNVHVPSICELGYAHNGLFK